MVIFHSYVKLPEGIPMVSESLCCPSKKKHDPSLQGMEVSLQSLATELWGDRK